MSSFNFLLREFLHSMSQNRFLLFTYGAQAAISLLVLGIFFVLLVGAAVFWNKLGSAMDVHVFLEDSASSQQINQLETSFNEIPEVKSVYFRSKEEALDVFSKRHASIRLSDLEMDNPLPASFIVKVDKPAEIEAFAKVAERMPGVLSVRYGDQILDRYMRLLSILIAICAVTMFLLVVFTFSSISNIIGLSIYARRTEIRIMQLVGASWWFIRWPFIFEGVFFGVTGAISALVVIMLLLAMLGEALRLSELEVAIPAFDISGDAIVLGVATLLLSLGAVVGFAGSLRTVNAFLYKELDAVITARRMRHGVRQ